MQQREPLRTKLAGLTHAEPSQAAAYEDNARPRHVGLPVMVLAGAGIAAAGCWLAFLPRSGRGPEDGRNDGGADARPGGGGGGHGRLKSTPRSAAEARLLRQRAERAEAAEARLQMPARGRGAVPAGLTPLGEAIAIARKVDEVEASLSQLEASLREEPRDSTPVDEKEQARIAEALMQCQLALDGVQGDESVRPMRRVQTIRIQRLLSTVESLAIQPSAASEEMSESAPS